MEPNESVELKLNGKAKEVYVYNKQPVPDGGYGWATVLGGFFTNFISAGILYSFGLIYIQLLNEFKESKGYTSWVMSLMTGLGSLAGPVASFFVKKFGCRAVAIAGSLLCAVSFFASSFANNVFTLIVTIGGFVGFGFGFVYLPGIVIVATYFEKHRALATGISLSGSGVGTFLMAPLVSFLIEKYGWRGTLRALSGIMLICASFGALFRPLFSAIPPNCSSEEPDTCKREQDMESRNNGHFKQTETTSTNFCCKNGLKQIFTKFVKATNLSLLNNPIFMLFAVADFATCLGYYVPYFLLADRASVLGISSENASHLLSIIGIINTISRIIMGYISDKPWVNRLLVYNISLIICGIATAVSVLCRTFKTLVIYSVVFGFASGVYVTLQSVILTDLLGLEKLESAFGLMLLFEGFSIFIGPPTVGFLFDQTHSYTPGFLFAGTMIAFSGVETLFMPILQKYVKRRQLQYENDQIENDIAS